MKDLKVYIVKNVDDLKKLCEKKLGDTISAEDYIEMERFKNENVYLVPHVPHGNRTYLQERYDIYNATKNNGRLENIIAITLDDIDKLLSHDSIEDLRDYQNWKTILGFKVVDTRRFYDKLFKIVSPEEFIAIINILNRTNKARYNYEFYIARDDKTTNIYMKNEKTGFAYKLPHTELNDIDLSYLIKNSIVETIDCRTKDTNEMNFAGRLCYILPDNTFLRNFSIEKKNRGYIAKAIIRGNAKTSDKYITVHGDSIEDARNKIQEKMQQALAHTNTNITSKLYNDLIIDEKDKEF